MSHSPLRRPGVALALGVALAAPTPALAVGEGAIEAEASYFDGLERYRARDYAGAMDRFEDALRAGPSAALRERALQAFVRSALELSPTDRDAACRRLGAHRDALERLSPVDDAGRQALQDLQVLEARCAPPDPAAGLDSSGRPLPRPTPPTRPDYGPALGLTLGGALALAGGAGLFVLALGEVDDRDGAGRRFREATDESERVAAARAVGDHEGRAESYGLGSTLLLGTGAVLTGLAIWAWASPPERLDVPFAVRVGPRWLGVGGVF